MNTFNTNCSILSSPNANHLPFCFSPCPFFHFSFPMVLSLILLFCLFPTPPFVSVCHRCLISSSLLLLSYGLSAHTFNVMIFSSQWFSIAKGGLTFLSKPSFWTLLIQGGRFLWESDSWLWSLVMVGCELYTKSLENGLFYEVDFMKGKSQVKVMTPDWSCESTSGQKGTLKKEKSFLNNPVSRSIRPLLNKKSLLNPLYTTCKG